MQDKKYGGSEQGEESTAGGVSAVRKGIVLAFLLMTCAVALPNTVTNDVVVATSDAELRISDRGLGLGLEVVGGGAAEVKLEARPGWRFRDGSTSVTLMKAAGEAATSPEVEGEGKGAESYVPGIEVGDDDEDGDDEDGSVEHEKPVLSLTASAPKVVAYSVLDGGTSVSIALSATVTKEGKHRKLDAEGNVVEETEFSPKRYVWKMSGVATGEAETSSASHTFTVRLTKGENKVLNFSVVGKDCEYCDEDVETSATTDSVTIDVYELSISRGPYLGLDRTDEGRKSRTVKDASVAVSPEFSGTPEVQWTDCGICEFVGSTNQCAVQYRNKDFETASESVGKERLAASVKLAGMDSSVVCSTNFTVVKVDIELSDIVEKDDETALPPVEFVADNADGSLSKAGLRSLYQMQIKCEPYDVPGSVDLQFSSGIRLFEITSFDGDKPVSAVPAQSSYPCGEIGQKKFGIHGLSASVLEVGELIVARHALSGALDYARVKVVPPPPLEVSVKFDSPAKGGGWPYDPVWDDPEWEATVNGSLAEKCAGDSDVALVIHSLSRDASKVEGVVYKSVPLWIDEEIEKLSGMDCSEGVHTNVWEIGASRKTDEYYAKVVAIEKETGEPRNAESNHGEVVRGDYYTTGANEIELLKYTNFVSSAEEKLDHLERVVSVTILVGGGAALLAKVTSALEMSGAVIKAISALETGGSIVIAVWTKITDVPDWLKEGVKVYHWNWTAKHWRWSDSAGRYEIVENRNVQEPGPPLGTGQLTMWQGVFEMGYEKYTKMAKTKDGADVEIELNSGYYSLEVMFFSAESVFDPINFNGYRLGKWAWSEKPYGLKAPSCVELFEE